MSNEFRAMHSAITVVADGDGAARAVAAVPHWFARWERCCSRFEAASELARLNADPRTTVPVSATLFAVLATALRVARATDGLVTPTVLDALEQAGYAQTIERVPHDGPAVPIPRPLTAAWRAVELRPSPRRVRRPPGLRFDLGGFAKGWAADRAVHRLRRCGPVLVDAGGDIAATGPRADGSAWPIAVAAPFPGDEPIARVGLMRGGIATSGRDRRQWQRGGVAQHHLIDPRTGAPAATDVLTATVLGPSVVVAEAAAKVVLLRGRREGLAWLARHAGPHALVVTADGRVHTSVDAPFTAVAARAFSAP